MARGAEKLQGIIYICKFSSMPYESDQVTNGGQQSWSLALAVHHGELHVGLLDHLVGPAGHVCVAVEDSRADVPPVWLSTVLKASIFVALNKDGQRSKLG